MSNLKILGSAIKSTQLVLPFTCSVCPYKLLERCEGPESVDSLFRQAQSMIGCRDNERQMMFYHDLYGRDYPQPQYSRQEDLELPSFIPVVKDGLPQLLPHDPRILYGVSLGTLLKESGCLRFNGSEDLRRKLRLPLEARLALIGTSPDRRLERFWHLSKTHDVWRRIAELSFEFSTSCTFSVWDKHPRYDQIYNQDRNFLSHDLLAQVGVPSIPFLFFYNEHDFREVVAWLIDRPDVSKVAMLAQFYRAPSRFEEFIKKMRAISNAVPRPIDFLVVGVATQEKITRIIREFKTATIITNQPILKALKGSLTLENLRHDRADASLTRDKLAVRNIEYFIKYCESLRTESLTQKAGRREIKAQRLLDSEQPLSRNQIERR